MSRIKTYLLARLQESSTWWGLIALGAGLLGYDLAPELQAQLVQVALALMGLVAAVSPDAIRPRGAEDPAARRPFPGPDPVPPVRDPGVTDRLQRTPVPTALPRADPAPDPGRRALDQLDRLTGN